MAAALLTGSGSGPTRDEFGRAAPRRWLGGGAHVLGGALGGAVLGVILAALTAVTSVDSRVQVAMAVALCGAGVWLSMPRFAPVRGVGLHWQVPRRLSALGPCAQQVYWGALLGVGVLTVVPSSVALVLPAAAVASGSQGAALLAGTAYGLCRGLLAVIVSSYYVRRGATPGDVVGSYEPLVQRMRTVCAVLAPGAALWVLVLLAVGIRGGWAA
jgi:hypothetical protein